MEQYISFSLTYYIRTVQSNFRNLLIYIYIIFDGKIPLYIYIDIYTQICSQYIYILYVFTYFEPGTTHGNSNLGPDVAWGSTHVSQFIIPKLIKPVLWQKITGTHVSQFITPETYQTSTLGLTKK